MLLSIPKDKLVRIPNVGASLIDSTTTEHHHLLHLSSGGKLWFGVSVTIHMHTCMLNMS